MKFRFYTPKEIDKYSHYINQKFNRLTIIKLLLAGVKPVKNNTRFQIVPYIECVCDCGKKWDGQLSVVLNGGTKSCGCLFNEKKKLSKNKIHGMRSTKEGRAFYSAKNRCTNVNNKKYKDYGARGIRFLFKSFEEFFNEIGYAPSMIHSLDRKDNNGNYEIGNIRWATKLQQKHNQRKIKSFTNSGQYFVGMELHPRWNK